MGINSLELWLEQKHGSDAGEEGERESNVCQDSYTRMPVVSLSAVTFRLLGLLHKDDFG